MTYLFIGEDSLKKDAKIAEIKKTVLPSYDALNFDYEVLYGAKLDLLTLQKSLKALPALSKQRLVVIKEGHRLSSQLKEFLASFIQTQPNHVTLILDFDELELTASFVQSIRACVKMVQFPVEVKSNVFDMTRAIAMHKDTEALSILSSLLFYGEHPLKIMGALVWFWGKSRDQLSSQRFKKGLQALQEADLNIKRSRLKPEYALELLVVKLSTR